MTDVTFDVQYPAVVIPFTTANPELDPIDEAFIPMHELDKKVQELCMYPWRSDMAMALTC